MSELTFSGPYGLVLLLGQEVTQEARRLNQVFGSDNMINLDESVPHMSLYHAQFLNLPEGHVQDVLDSILPSFPITVSMMRFSVFAEKFLFWNPINQLQLAPLHHRALDLAKYVDLSATPAAEKDQLQLNSLELANLKRFGHPLVRNLWKPHITLGYFDKVVGVNGNCQVARSSIAEVAFARIGKYETVKESDIIFRRYA